MKLQWLFAADDVELVKATIARASTKKTVLDRRARNLASNKPKVTRERFWKALFCMRLTSRKASGPGSAVARFNARNPFPLRLEVLSHERNPDAYIRKVLIEAGKVGDYNTVAEQMRRNFEHLSSPAGGRIIQTINRLTGRSDFASVVEERSVANSLRTAFEGIGPKQSRNVLQALGVTRFEIPLDSRVMKWLDAKLRFPLPIAGALLADSAYYELVLDAVQALCGEANEFPCLLDGAIFSENETGDWDPAQLVY
jgi:predicted flap endonuclease-1-like 5' DNA nuclease